VVVNTSWQDPEEKEKNLNRFYQNFGMVGLVEEQKQFQITNSLAKLYKKILKKLKKQFRKEN
jgi:hypothetical protein